MTFPSLFEESSKQLSSDEEFAASSNVVLDEDTTPINNTTSNTKNATQAPASPLRRRREPIRLFDKTWKKWAWGLGGLTLFLLVVILLATSLKKVKSTEYGVQYTSYSKKLDDAARTGGLHIGPPGYKFIKFPSTYVTVDLPEDTCVSQDGLRVKFAVTFQYQMPAEWLLPAIQKYRDFERWAEVVEAAGNSAVHHSCSEFQISNFQNKRGIIQTTMEENLRTKLEGIREDGSDGVYARAISLQLRNVDLPEEYRVAIREKQSAAEDIVLAQNQVRLLQTTTYSDELSFFCDAHHSRFLHLFSRREPKRRPRHRRRSLRRRKKRASSTTQRSTTQRFS